MFYIIGEFRLPRCFLSPLSPPGSCLRSLAAQSLLVVVTGRDSQLLAWLLRHSCQGGVAKLRWSNNSWMFSTSERLRGIQGDKTICSQIHYCIYFVVIKEILKVTHLSHKYRSSAGPVCVFLTSQHLKINISNSFSIDKTSGTRFNNYTVWLNGGV